MSENQPSLLRVTVFDYVGLQVVLLGFMMLSLGILIGTNLVGIPAYQSMQASLPVGVRADVPAYLKLASKINLLAAGSTVLSLAGLIYLDWVNEDG